jgi:SAM-dependent methyltransferase
VELPFGPSELSAGGALIGIGCTFEKSSPIGMVASTDPPHHSGNGSDMSLGSNDPTPAAAIPHPSQIGFQLFLVGFLVLFLELACIRWFATYVIFLQFFTNVALIASFLGMSCGCLAARSRRDWLCLFPLLTLGAVVGAFTMNIIYNAWGGVVVDVGHQAAPQEVFFGTNYRNTDMAQFAVPIELIAGIFFVLIALMFVGLGQVLGRAFDAYANRVAGYSLNIGGSLAGILGFSALSMLQTPPVIWFLIVAIGVGYLLWQAGTLTPPRVLALLLVPAMIVVPGVLAGRGGIDLRWSPYYAVYHDRASGWIAVNNIGFQKMMAFEEAGRAYSLIHLLRAHSGGEPFHDVLVIGAGSGNDIAHALHFGADRIDAVEIDPAIQDIGIESHPNRPYQDARVVPIIDDGRHFLRTTNRKYDLVVYAQVDSLILHSGYSNIRLESYLFTREAFEDIKRVLNPDGVFVTYNQFRQGWVVERVAAMVEDSFGCKPIILSLPYRETLRSSDHASTTMIIATCNNRIADAFATHGQFWLNDVPTKNLGIDGFTLQPAALPTDQQSGWAKVAPTTLVRDVVSATIATDDWPFLYLRDRLVPNLSLRSVFLMGAVGLVMIYLFLPKTAGGRAGGIRIDGRMFFLGAAFMLLETKAVVQLALLFGSTWLVNSLVFTTVLILILLANLYVLRVREARLAWHYVGLLILLATAAFVPTDLFVGGGVLWGYAAPAALALGPMFFAGVIFAQSFRDARYPDQAFGSNIAGAVVGGFCESFSMLLGFRYLLLLAVLFYLLSAWIPLLRSKRHSPG